MSKPSALSPHDVHVVSWGPDYRPRKGSKLGMSPKGPRNQAPPHVARCWGFGFGVQGFRVRGSGFRVQASGFRVQGSGFRV